MAAKKTSSKPGAAPKAKAGRPTIKSSHEGRGFPARKARAGAAKSGDSATRGKAGAKRLANANSAIPMPTGKPLPAPRAKKRAGGGASVASDAARRTAILVAVAALEKKAVGLEILDVAGRVDYADFLVLMTGRSDRQVAALAQGIEEVLRNEGVRATSVEGMPHANWVLMDFGDVVVHVFQEGARKMYDLDGLWADVNRVPVPGEHGLN